MSRLWDRLLWGVMFTGASKSKPFLLGDLWDDTDRMVKAHEGCPTRTLLFQTRAQARAWCDAQHAKYLHHYDFCRKWRFRPVRVRERVEVLR